MHKIIVFWFYTSFSGIMISVVIERGDIDIIHVPDQKIDLETDLNHALAPVLAQRGM